MDQAAQQEIEKPIPFASQTPQSTLKRMRLAAVHLERPLWELITEAFEEWLNRNDQS